MFERFTDRARRVLSLAQEESRLMGHSFIGTEHVLLGLIEEGEGVAARALGELNVSLTAAREQVERIVGGTGSPPTGSPPFTPRAKKVLELSLREALQLGHHYIGTEHLLLGLVREGEGVAVQVLVALGSDPLRVRQKVLQMMAGGGTRVEPEVPGGKWRTRAGVRLGRGEVYGPVSSSEVSLAASDSCATCGRDLWEAAHYIVGEAARVCDECIRAAVAVLTAAEAESRALALPPRVFGEVPEAGSVDELIGVVDAFVGSAAGRQRRADVIEDAAAFETRLRTLDERLNGTSRVSRIRFVSPDVVELRFLFGVAGHAEVSAEGPARRIEGRWVLSGASVADALERAGIRALPAGRTAFPPDD